MRREVTGREYAFPGP